MSYVYGMLMLGLMVGFFVSLIFIVVFQLLKALSQQSRARKSRDEQRSWEMEENQEKGDYSAGSYLGGVVIFSLSNLLLFTLLYPSYPQLAVMLSLILAIPSLLQLIALATPTRFPHDLG